MFHQYRGGQLKAQRIDACSGGIPGRRGLIEGKMVLTRLLLIGPQTDEEKKLKKAKDAQAKANLAVKKQETVVKTAERALEDKVSNLTIFDNVTWMTDGRSIHTLRRFG